MPITASSPLPTPGPIDGSAAARAAREELRHAVYHRDDANLVQRALHWLSDRLDGLGGGSVTGWAALVLLSLLAAVLLFAVIRAGRPRRIARGRATQDPLAGEQNADHRGRALALSAQGRHAEALREWLRDCVRTLEQRGVLSPRPGRTAAEIAREAGAVLPAAAGELAAAARAFDEVWFGDRPAGEQDAQLGRLAADSVRQTRIGPAGPVAGYAVPR